MGDIFPSNDINYNESALLVQLIRYIFIIFYTKIVLLETCTTDFVLILFFFHIETQIKADFFCIFSKIWGQTGTTDTPHYGAIFWVVFFLTFEHFF